MLIRHLLMLIRQNAGPIALGITLPAWMTSLFVQAEPVLHDLALLTTITSGTFAAIWYWRQLHK